MQQILYYFPKLSKLQIQQFKQLKSLYLDWSSKINVISHKNMHLFYQNHVLHSLAIAKVIQFKSNTQILDVGTGGGFPGIPLSILFPDSDFLLIDSITKKIKVVENISDILQLKNVKSKISRAEKLKQKFDFIVSRAVTQMEKFVFWTQALFKSSSFNELNNGILYLKGGNLNQELQNFPQSICYNISDFYFEDFFKTKQIVYLKSDFNTKKKT